MIGEIQEGRYRIVAKLGEGGQGEVWLVEHLHLGRTEALKVLRSQHAEDEHFVSRFRREARATNRVQHPNIVGVYDFGRLSDGRYFLAMEYVEGERLDAVIGGAPLSVRRTLRIGGQLARALAHAHGHGVVHRDLKPANLILVNRRGHADFLKVLDFGMAKIVGPDPGEPASEGDVDPHGLARTLEGQMFGTAPYMAPEQFLERGADPRMDIYASGCLLFEMLTGGTPFKGGMVRLMEQHLRVHPEAPSRVNPAGGIPAALDEVVLRCLAKRPSERYASAGELADALDGVAATILAPTRRPTRSKLGVVVPRPIDDFGGETDDSADAAYITEPGEEAPAGPATMRIGGDDAVEIAGAGLQEVGDALLDTAVTTAALVAGMAQLRDLRSQLARIRSEAEEIEARADALELSSRSRAASLSFAIGELTFDRAIDPGDEDTDAQIAELERSLAALHAASTHELAALDEHAIGLAAALHDRQEEHASTCRRLEPVMAPLLDRLTDQAERTRLRQRLEAVRNLIPPE